MKFEKFNEILKTLEVSDVKRLELKLHNELILFIVALTLLLILWPIGLVYAILKYLFWFKFKKGKQYITQLLRSASYCIDKLGNVLCWELFNDTLIEGSDEPFWDPNETISDNLWENKRDLKLSKLGKSLDRLLDKIDKNHSINSIE